jgi:hypothetical protein
VLRGQDSHQHGHSVGGPHGPDELAEAAGVQSFDYLIRRIPHR